MFTYKKTVLLRETDSTGVLYFSEQLNMAAEALESFFHSSGLSLQEMISKHAFLMPVVHAETDFMLPVHVGDQLTIELYLEKTGRSSMAFAFKFLREGQLVGKARIIHAVISKTSGESMPIPASLRKQLSSLPTLALKG